MMEHGITNAALAAKPLLDWAGTMLTSWLAWRIYVLLAAAIVTGLSLWTANRHRGVIVDVNVRPSRATTRRGLRRAMRYHHQLISDKRGEVFRQAMLVLVLGFLIPSTVLGFMIYFYSWFIPGHDALSVAKCPYPMSVAPTFLGTGLYVFSQVAMGMTNKMSFLADGALARALPAYMPANGIIATVVIGYRYFIGLFAGAFTHLLYAAWRLPAKPELQAQFEDLKKKFEAADH